MKGEDILDRDDVVMQSLEDERGRAMGAYVRDRRIGEQSIGHAIQWAAEQAFG